MRVRIVPTFKGKYTVQVVSKYSGKLTVHKHLGTFATEVEKQNLIKEAKEYIKTQTGQEELFSIPQNLQLKNVVITQSRPLFLYRLLCRIYNLFGFDQYDDSLIRDLVVARVFQPQSKRETREVMSDLFGIDYSIITIYRHLKKEIDHNLKDQFQTALINFAKTGLNDSLHLVFYDVTTLAFDSHAKAGLKDFGYSKDHRFQDVQIVVGLVVNRDGFPLYFDVFNGKTFEGKTFVTVVEKVKKLLNNPDLVVIADAAMISRINVEELDKRKVGFIVGTRLANLPLKLQTQISSEVSKIDLKTTTVKYLNHRLICQYSISRAAKDKSDREKQIEKAKIIISSPSRISSRFRFVQSINGQYEVNNTLIEKAKRLEGIKGYLTNTNLPESTIIERYHDLWRIEKAFRITKTDLEARPIFLRLDKTITCHLIIVFAGLAIVRYLEIKTNMSIKRILKIAGKVLTHEVKNSVTGEKALIETTIIDEELKQKVQLLNSLGH
ncbi:MAG: IS1634 family transposase [Candidatus Roizmanbacteria bacterium]|nr:IS1634 family transposase [Candidatus Roizmanbacteria bacterium]